MMNNDDVFCLHCMTCTYRGESRIKYVGFGCFACFAGKY
jgi:hypothetical protein